MSGWRTQPLTDEIDLEANYGKESQPFYALFLIILSPILKILLFFSCECGNPIVLSICLVYGGEFTKFLGRKYIKGQHKFVDLIDNDLFSIHDIDDMMEELGYVEEGRIMYYHFKRPLRDLDFGLFALGSDQNANHLSEALCGSSDSEGSVDSSDSDNSDFIVDEDNLLDDPEVDMHDFYLNIDDNLE
uniref:PB1-like domain-containing protein n=1 Tax=Lactuca sativa TaxID=4236 RepID=A0A9R1XGZ8_LACSA|nr:hypothetical protein LSAT_V11C400177300 [Lactuca sativa]